LISVLALWFTAGLQLFPDQVEVAVPQEQQEQEQC